MMNHVIQYIAEPRRLILAWQAPDHMGDRFRWAVGIIDTEGSDCAFRYLPEGSEFQALNGGRTRSQLSALGYLGHPAFSLGRAVHDRGVLPTFMRRLPPRSRPDFGAFLRLFGFSPDAHPSDFALLAYTGAKLPSDGFSLVDPLQVEAERVDLVLEVAGTRYQPDWPTIGDRSGAPVTLDREPENPVDPSAIRVLVGNACIGYVNRLQVQTVSYWMSHRSIQASIYRLNGEATKPKVFVFLSVRPLANLAAA